MIIGFGFGSPLTAILMLIATSLVSYALFRLVSRRPRTRDPEQERDRLRRFYVEQRQAARRMAQEFDLSDDEIERRIEEDMRKR